MRPGAELAGFQRDLGSLRRLAHSFRPAYRKVRPSLLLGGGSRCQNRAQLWRGSESADWSGPGLGAIHPGSCCVCLVAPP